MSVARTTIYRYCQNSLVGGLALAATLSQGTAAERGFVGPRATGMGGVGVASTKDIHAQYYNPAAFAFMARNDDDGVADEGDLPEMGDYDNNGIGNKRWGLGGDFAFGVQLYGNLVELLDIIEEIDNIQLANKDNITAADAEQVVGLLTQITALDAEGLGIQVDVNAGAGFRWGQFAVGARYFADAVGTVTNVDLVNVGLDDISELTGSLDSNASTIIGQTAASYTNQTLSAAQQSQLAAAGFSIDAVKAIDSVITDQVNQGNVTLAEINDAVDAVAQVPLSADGSLADNSTSVTLVGLGVLEIPVSYGYAFNEQFSIGATAKAMFGRVYGTKVIVFDEDADDVIEAIDEEYEETFTFGVDIGAMYRFKNFQIGLTGRNLNKPKFDGVMTSRGAQIPDVEIDPTVTAGVAWMPFKTLTVEVNGDLIKHDALFKIREVQYLGGGVEWDAFKFLALRAGAYGNLAESDESVTLTAGLGFNFWLMRLDLAGAYGLDTVTYDGDDYPTDVRFSAGLGADW